MAKVTSNDPEAQDALRRLGKKLPSGAAKQDRSVNAPTKAGREESIVSKAQSNTKNVKASESYVGNGEQSPGGVMGHKSKPAPVKITAKKADKRS